MKKFSKYIIAFIIPIFFIILILISSALVLNLYFKEEDDQIMGHEELKEIIQDRLESGEDIMDISKDPPRGWRTEVNYNTTFDYGVLGFSHLEINTTMKILYECPSVIDEPSSNILNIEKEYGLILSFILNIHPIFNEYQIERFYEFTNAVEDNKLYANFELYYEDYEITVIYFSYFVGNSLNPKLKGEQI